MKINTIFIIYVYSHNCQHMFSPCSHSCCCLCLYSIRKRVMPQPRSSQVCGNTITELLLTLRNCSTVLGRGGVPCVLTTAVELAGLTPTRFWATTYTWYREPHSRFYNAEKANASNYTFEETVKK